MSEGIHVGRVHVQDGLRAFIHVSKALEPVLEGLLTVDYRHLIN